MEDKKRSSLCSQEQERSGLEVLSKLRDCLSTCRPPDALRGFLNRRSGRLE